MSSAAHPDEQAIVAAFLEQLLDDRRQGVTRSLADYQRRFPGHETLIAVELARVEQVGGDGVAPAVVPGSEPEVGDDLVRGQFAQRYRDEEEIAVGGMGTIYRVWDPLLQRRVAKKVLGSRRLDRGTATEMLGRFLDEAKVTAQLDHPGVVPVHELGLDAQGRVYFTMSLVRGRNFKQVIELVHAGRDGWTRTRAIGVLQRVCEAVAFAHSKGVIHRDLKPANIMVGPFGQTYVLDWGLARVERPDGSPAEPAPSPRNGGAPAEPAMPGLTHEGDVVGTPAYMAPEQARGELAAVGPRSDVYAIGAMLYHLLAGRMPHTDGPSTTWREALDATLAGPPTPLRSLARGLPEELIAITERAMARDPARRYASAADLGEDLRAFLETRVVQAHRTGAWAELRKWVRRNRLAAAAAALALAALVAGLAASLWLERIADDNARRAATQAETQQAVLDFLNKDLLAAVAPGAVGRDATMREVLDRAAESIEGRFPDRPLVEAAVRRTIGDTYRRLGVLEEAERHAQRSVELYSAHAADDAALTLDARRVLAIIYGRLNRQHDAERENREILAISRRAFGDEHYATLTAANNLGLTLTYLGRHEEAEPLLLEVYQVRRRLLGEDHDQTLVSMCNLGLLYYYAGRYREAEPLIRGEMELCSARHGEANPGTLVSMNNWANLLQAMGRSDEAIRQHERIIRISEQIHGPRHPQTVQSLGSLTRVLMSVGRHPEARELLAVMRERAADLPADHGVRLAIAGLAAELHLEAGDVDGAVAAFGDLLDWQRRVAGDRAPDTLQTWRRLAEAIRADDRPADALATIDAAIAAGGTADTVELARQRLLRGRLLVDLERFAEAEQALLAAERHFAAHPTQGPDRQKVVDALVEVYRRSGRHEQAAEWARRRQ